MGLAKGFGRGTLSPQIKVNDGAVAPPLLTYQQRRETSESRTDVRATIRHPLRRHGLCRLG